METTSSGICIPAHQPRVMAGGLLLCAPHAFESLTAHLIWWSMENFCLI